MDGDGVGGRIDPKKVAVYIRWSTDEQGEGTTLEVQTEKCTKWMDAAKNWTINPDLVFVDDGYSGSIVERPGLTRLRERVRAGEVHCVVVYRLDRLSRNIVHTVNLVLEEWKDRCALYSATEEFNTDTPMGKMAFGLLALFAQFERESIRERTQGGKRKRAEQGRNAGQRYPYGYKKAETPFVFKGQPYPVYAIDGWDPETEEFTGPAAIVRRIFDEYARGYGSNSIALRLNQDNIPSPEGKAWGGDTVRRIVANPAYKGVYQYGLSVWPRGEKRTFREDGPAFMVEGALPPIIPSAEWDAVQRMKADRVLTTPSPKSAVSPYILTGIAKCAKCGTAIVGKNNFNRRWYQCNAKYTTGCDCGTISAELVESIVVNKVKEMLTGEEVQAHVQSLQESLRQTIAEREHALREAEAQLQEMTRRKEMLEEDYFSRRISAEGYDRLTRRADEGIQQSSRRVEETKEALRQAQAMTVDLGGLRAVSERLDVWSELSVEEMKQVLRDVIYEVRVYQLKRHQRTSKPNPNKLTIEITPRTGTFLRSGA
jgi:site-specific DNA recombinase